MFKDYTAYLCKNQYVGRKCMLATLHAAPCWVTLSMRRVPY